MKKTLIPILLILLFLAACNNDRVNSSDTQSDDSGKSAINHGNANNAIQPDLCRFRRFE